MPAPSDLPSTPPFDLDHLRAVIRAQPPQHVRFILEGAPGTPLVKARAALLNALGFTHIDAAHAAGVRVTRLFRDPHGRTAAPGMAEQFVLTLPPFDATPADLFQAALALQESGPFTRAEPDLSFLYPEQVDEADPDAAVWQAALAGRLDPQGAGGIFGRGAEAPTLQNWSLRAMRIPAAHDLTRGAGVTVAHIDTGWTAHPQLDQGSLDLTHAYNVLTETADARDPLTTFLRGTIFYPGHGTATGSIAVGLHVTDTDIPDPAPLDGIQPGAVAPDAHLLPIRFSNSVMFVTAGHLAQAIEYAAAQPHVGVITMSLGGLPARALERALVAAVRRNILVIASAGNGIGWVVAPALYPVCAAAAASNAAGAPWQGTSHGPAVTVAVPGEQVWRATYNGELQPCYLPGSGTSFSAANLAGVAALWLAHHGRDNLIAHYQGTGVVLQDVFMTLLRQTARRPLAWDAARYGAGIVDAAALLEAELPDDVPPRDFSTWQPTSTWELLKLAMGNADPAADAPRLRTALGDEAEPAATLAHLLNIDAAQTQALVERHGPELFHALLSRPALRQATDSGSAQPALSDPGAERLRTAGLHADFSPGLRSMLAALRADRA
jgi:hypothetical protein